MSRINKQFIFLFFLTPITAFALSSDGQKIAYLSADWAKYNRNSHISTYLGHIKFMQGTTHLSAQKLIVYDDKSSNKINKMIAFGKRAHYSTLPDGKKYILNAKANIIEYYANKDIAILKGNGEITQHGNKISGPYIIYNIKQQTIIVNSVKKNRATIILQP